MMIISYISSTTAFYVIAVEQYAVEVITSLCLLCMYTKLEFCVAQTLEKFKEVSSLKSDQACATGLMLMRRSISEDM